MKGTDGKSPRGAIYRCPICGAELTVLSYSHGDFHPRCCNVAMVRIAKRAAFYVCPICGAEIALLRAVDVKSFAPRCCNVAMRMWAA